MLWDPNVSEQEQMLVKWVRVSGCAQNDQVLAGGNYTDTVLNGN